MSSMLPEGRHQSDREQYPSYQSPSYSPHDSKMNYPKYPGSDKEFAPLTAPYGQPSRYPVYNRDALSHAVSTPPVPDDSLRNTKKPAQRRRELLEDHIRNSTGVSKLLDQGEAERMVVDSESEKYDRLSLPSKPPTPTASQSGRNIPISDILSNEPEE